MDPFISCQRYTKLKTMTCHERYEHTMPLLFAFLHLLYHVYRGSECSSSHNDDEVCSVVPGI